MNGSTRLVFLCLMAVMALSACGGGGGDTSKAPAPTLSSDASASDLVISAGVLSPAFQASQLQYDVLVDPSMTTINVAPTTTHSSARVSVNGNAVTSGTASPDINLAVGDNTVTVIVTAENGSTTRTYTLTVTRLSDDATLAGLFTSSGVFSPGFSPNVPSYDVSVDASVNSITVTPTTSAANAVVTVDGIEVPFGNASGSIALTNGEANIQVMVTAEDGTTTRTYTLSAHNIRQDANLSDLVLSSGALDQAFDAGTFDYTQTTNATSLNVTPTLSDANASVVVRVNGQVSTPDFAHNLVLGGNTITAVVTAEDGATTQTYTVVLTRLDNDADLAGLQVSSGPFDQPFARDTFNYTHTTNATSLTVSPSATRNPYTSTITVNGIEVASGSPSPYFALNIGINTFSVVVVAGDGVTTQTYTITVNRINNDASLSGLALSSGAMDQAFASGTFNYTQNTNATSLTVTPTATDNNASVTVDGSAVTSGSASQAIALALGSNTITAVVTATDGVGTQTYTITVTRLNDEATLSGLVVSSGALDQAFSPDTFNYTQTTDATSLTVTPSVADNSASVTVNGSAATSGIAGPTIPLVPGDNSITIVVTAEDGTTTQTYTIAVDRLNNDATLSGLNFSSGALDQTFASTTFSYTQTTNATSLTVTPGAVDNNASVTVNGSAIASGSASQAITLTLGANTITVVVTADDGATTQTYTVVVTRQNNDATLSGLLVSSGALDQAFSPDTFNYTQTTDVASLTVTPTVSDNNASITINSSAVVSGSASQPIALVTGVNTISVVVVAEDGTTTQTYTVAVTIQQNDDANLSSLVLTTGSLDQAFSPSTLNYTHATNATSLRLTPTLSDPNAEVRVNGTIFPSGSQTWEFALSVGSNTINLVVTASDGTTTQTYTVIVTRLSTNANLSSLALSTGALDQSFTPSTFNYSHTTNATSLTVTATASDTDATMSINGSVVVSGSASSSIALDPGSNAITVAVIAEDGSTSQSYVIAVTRLNNDASLTNLTLSGGFLDQVFQSALYDYTSTVGYLESAVAIIAEAPHGANVTVNGMTSPSGAKSEMVSLDEGPNTITVTVVAEDDSVTEIYTIIITRQAANTFAQQALLGGSAAISVSNGSMAVAGGGVFVRDGAGTWTAQPGVNIGANSSVSLDGDTLAIGVPGSGGATGSVYVFTRDASGIWSQEANITAWNAGGSDAFGFSVALSGDLLAVGAPQEDSDCGGVMPPGDMTVPQWFFFCPGIGDNDNAFASGAVYTFGRGPSGWTEQAYIKAPVVLDDFGRKIGSGSYLFGRAVALDGNWLAVGAPHRNNIITNPGNLYDGAAYLYEACECGLTGWEFEATIRPIPRDSYDYFGTSVSLSGDTLAVGAYGEDSSATGIGGDQFDNSSENSGAAYVYIYYPAFDSWGPQAYLKASDTEPSDAFGFSLSLSGNTLAVGALNSGSAYVFMRDAITDVWSQQNKIAVGGGFSRWLSLSGDTLAVVGDGTIYIFK